MPRELEPRPRNQGNGHDEHAPKTAPRLAACEGVAEAALIIGAAIATDELPERLDELLRTLQSDLSDVRADLEMPVPEEKRNRVRHTHIARVDEVRKKTEVGSRQDPPRSGSHSADLLRYAAAVTGRAEKAAGGLVSAELLAVYLNHLAALLLALADHAAHEADRRIAFGVCGNPWLHPALAPDLRT